MIPSQMVTENINRILTGPAAGYYLTESGNGSIYRWLGPIKILREAKRLSIITQKVKDCLDCILLPSFVPVKLCLTHSLALMPELANPAPCSNCRAIGVDHQVIAYRKLKRFGFGVPNLSGCWGYFTLKEICGEFWKWNKAFSKIYNVGLSALTLAGEVEE